MNNEKYKIDYVDNLKVDNGKEMLTPMSVNSKEGTIEIPKSMFDKNSIHYHRFKVKNAPLMVYHELHHIEGNIKHKVNITNKRIKEWIEYADKELKQYRESKAFLTVNRESVDNNFAFTGALSAFRMRLIKLYWWRLGIYGIKERWEYFKLGRKINKILKRNGLQKD